MITVFHYQRNEMLDNLLTELRAFKVPVQVIVDDIEVPECYERHPGVAFHMFQHGGKKDFWRRWQYAFDRCKEAAGNFFMFLPDDFSQIDVEKIQQLHSAFRYPGEPFVWNLVNDGRGPQWNAKAEIKIGLWYSIVHWTDCAFFCDRQALEAIRFEMQPIHVARFRTNSISSGVGQQLTNRFNKACIPMYRPTKSLAYHGDHESLMHPEERKRNPLISR